MLNFLGYVALVRSAEKLGSMAQFFTIQSAVRNEGQVLDSLTCDD